MGGMREHIEQLHLLDTIIFQSRNILSHRLSIAAGIENIIRRHFAKIFTQFSTDPLRGGLTSTNSGTSPSAEAKRVESSAENCTFCNPNFCADRVAQAIASALISIPVSFISGVAQCKPKPPTPQNRSHILLIFSLCTHLRAVAYNDAATSGLVWKKLCGRI